MRGTILALTLVGCLSTDALASTVAREWYFGAWSCRIDGRSARMEWRVVDDPQTSCSGDVCSSTSGVAIRGRFSDNGSRWVPLTGPMLTGQGRTHFTFRHADGNRWYLDRRNAQLAVGQTTWQGKRYPLSCTRT